ncbi:MAG: protein-L-isoaspartate(D-aspartate) O-methyltransferase [Alphaproteobacteria bacterium]|nr:protein-L-isoaspartate(D-aspartate) O-methyltransferase [Alphaproteobacteria bacterium]
MTRLRRAIATVVLLAATAPNAACGAGGDDDAVTARARMVETIRAYAAMPGSGAPGGRISDRVLAAMAAVPRHELVPEPHRDLAYADTALPIGFGQTISQPYIVALMTELVRPGPKGVMLEVGTGSGYQAAVLARLVGHVYTIEIVDALARRAGADLARLGFANVTVKSGDGYKGWPARAPFHGIVVTAAPKEVPPPLIEQLRPGGRLVMPLEDASGHQSLVVLEKDAAGGVVRRTIIPVRFVPLTRKAP